MTEDDVGEGEKLENGIIFKDGKIVKAESDYIMTYIMSDNYIYTLKNENIVTQIQESGGADGWLTEISNAIRRELNVFTSAGRFLSNLSNLIMGPFADLVGVTDLSVTSFGHGMLVFYYEPDDIHGNPAVGVRGKPYNSGSMWNWDSIVADSEKKVLKITRSINKPVEFSVDGWVGRYGMPLEFLMSIHLSTLKPDLAYDMVTQFPTNVNIYLHQTAGEANVVYETTTSDGSNKNLSPEDIAGMSQDVIAARDNGLDVGYGGDKCGCTFTDQAGASLTYDSEDQKYKYEDGTIYEGEVKASACDECLAKLAAIQLKMANVKLDNFNVNAYQPYIASVTDHWFRDVYYVLDESTIDEVTSGIRNMISKIISLIPLNDIKEQAQAILDSTTTDEELVEKLKQFLDGTTIDERFLGGLKEILDSTTIDENAERALVDDKDIRFVDYDYDYESLYKERWTRYETENGEFVLYRLNPDGSYGEKFDGTQEEANKQNIKVAKKALTIDRDELIDDLDWNYNEYIVADVVNGSLLSTGRHKVWSAYEATSSSSRTSVAISDENKDEDEEETGETEDEEENEEGENAEETQEEKAKKLDKEISEHIKVSVNQYGNIVQKGEAQRTETNPKIKNLFLQNVYFTYDGGPEKAEAIYDLRSQIAAKKGKAKWYGAIPSDCMDLSTTVNGKTYTVADCSSGVSRTITTTNSENGKTTTQELLNVSSMLENIHTADADYISRDFKELIVELGYYTKEELTDETPRMLEWLVPDTGSYGYPKRVIDKNENEYGTMIHSKGDVDAAKEQMKQELYKRLAEQYVEPERGGIVDDSSKANVQKTVGNISQDNSFEQLNQVNYSAVKGIGGTQNCSREDQSGDDGCVALVTVDGVEYKNYVQYSSVYGGEHFNWSGADKTIARAGCGPVSCVNILTGYGQDVNPQNTVAGLNFNATIDGVGQFMEEHEVPGHTCYDAGQYVSEMEAAFSEGKPFVVLFNNNAVLGEGDFWTTSGHFVPFVGYGSDGLYTCDPAGPGNGKRFIFPGSPSDLVSAIDGIWFADIAPTGIKKEGKPYTGYNGNEAVVSPVTGILLEYGTYSNEEMNLGNGVTEEYRVNVDYKYNSNGSGEDGEAEVTNTNIPVDKVGYAKILVLDNKTYSLFEKKFSGELSSLNSGKSFVNSNGTLNDINDLDKDKIKDWSDKEKTLYGYKEFAELYERGGIAGNIVYIDGFVCEYPDENYPTGSKEDTEENEEFKNGNFIPNGESINKDHFKKIQYNDISGKNEDIKTSYIKDAEYKFASKKATEKYNAEATIKDDASPSLYTGGTVKLKLNENSDEVSYDGIFIKEGTVIGRTMTDKELLEELRGNSYGTYDELRGDSDSENSDDENKEYHIIGNYLRVLMQDINRDIVEDVENYMKLDDGNEKNGKYYDLEKIDENSSMEDKIRAIISYFVDKGFTVEAACGICGNLMVESPGLDPSTTNPYGYHGLAQWDPSSRWPKVRGWILNEYDDEDKFAGQVRAIYEQEDEHDRLHESELSSCNNIEEATEMFCLWFEGAIYNPSVKCDPTKYIEPGKLLQGLDSRKKNAQKAYDVYMGGSYN